MTATIQKPGEQVVLNNEEFLNMLAHELRNPLAPIMNAVHVIERSCATGNPLLKNSADILSRQVNYVVGVINDLLDVAKIAKNELTPDRLKVNIGGVVNDSVEECRTIFNSRKLALEVTIPEKNIWVIGDPIRIQQIITHLLSNAAKFTETGGKISVTVNYGDRVMINIRDSGIGIPAESLSDIFTLFSASPHSPHNLNQGGGMGVGLMLAQKLAEMMGGSIEVSSEGVGKGSEFSIILPIDGVDDAISETIVPKKPESASRCLDIMVVDDHIDTAESLATLLKMWGHMIRICHSGTAAIRMAKTHNPEVALLDIGLPGCDGYQVAEKLKEECPNILLIAITGYGHRVDRRRSGNAGFHTHLVKPVVPEKLREALSEAFDG